MPVDSTQQQSWSMRASSVSSLERPVGQPLSSVPAPCEASLLPMKDPRCILGTKLLNQFTLDMRIAVT